MKTIKQKQLRILNETINNFNSTNRCVTENGSCNYYLEGKQGCAIGRLIEDKELCKKLDKLDYGGVSYHNVFDLLPDELKELTKGFLSDLQNLHDESECWNETGLTNRGLNRVGGIKVEFDLN